MYLKQITVAIERVEATVSKDPAAVHTCHLVPLQWQWTDLARNGLEADPFSQAKSGSPVPETIEGQLQSEWGLCCRHGVANDAHGPWWGQEL